MAQITELKKVKTNDTASSFQVYYETFVIHTQQQNLTEFDPRLEDFRIRAISSFCMISPTI